MDAGVLAEFRALPVKRRNALEIALSQLLARISDGPLPIRDAKNQFTAVNRAAAKRGLAQLVKGIDGGDETVIISVRDLASIIQTAAESMTLADALSLSHFRPAGGTLLYREENEGDNSFSMELIES